jgi:hypothetical protein
MFLSPQHPNLSGHNVIIDAVETGILYGVLGLQWNQTI